MGESLAVGAVEGFQIYLVEADACAYGHDGTQQFAMLTGIETRLWQLVPTFLLAQVAYVPGKIIIGLWTEPQLQYVTYAVALALHAKQAPCALKP